MVNPGPGLTINTNFISNFKSYGFPIFNEGYSKSASSALILISPFLLTIKRLYNDACIILYFSCTILYEEFGDTKEVIRIRKSKDRQHNGKKKNDKRTDNDLQNIAQNSKE